MTRKRFVAVITIATPVQAVIFGLITGNPNWLWNIPLGLAIGWLVGVLLWPTNKRFQAWLEGKDAKR